jgi:hypothetical protein
MKNVRVVEIPQRPMPMYVRVNFGWGDTSTSSTNGVPVDDFIRKSSIKRRKRVIGVIGTRRRDELEDFDLVHGEFRLHYHLGDSICSGLCSKGGDRFAVILSQLYFTDYIWASG